MSDGEPVASSAIQTCEDSQPGTEHLNLAPSDLAQGPNPTDCTGPAASPEVCSPSFLTAEYGTFSQHEEIERLCRACKGAPAPTPSPVPVPAALPRQYRVTTSRYLHPSRTGSNPCQAEFGPLWIPAEPRSDEDQSALEAAMEAQVDAQSVWIGITWAGRLQDTDRDQWVYLSDRSPLTWTNWDARRREPELLPPHDRTWRVPLVIMMNRGWTWADWNRDTLIWYEAPVVCQLMTAPSPAAEFQIYGSAGEYGNCPEGKEIGSLEECFAAHTALGIESGYLIEDVQNGLWYVRGSFESSAYEEVDSEEFPGLCSTNLNAYDTSRPFMYFNSEHEGTAYGSDSMRSRIGLAPVCRV